MDDRPICLPWDKIFCLDTPRTDSSLRRITEILLKFAREYGDILACQYPPGKDTEKSSIGVVPLLSGIAQYILYTFSWSRVATPHSCGEVWPPETNVNIGFDQ